MARQKATITLDRDKIDQARSLLGNASMSEIVDTALNRLIAAERLRRDVEAYTRQPLTAAELSAVDVPVEFDLGDHDVDYDALYG